MTIQVYNTLSRSKEVFEPVQPGRVGIYLCGPTVYDKAHIGHMVGPVIFDTIKRYLAYCGYDVTWVVNVTDVDDKLIVRAREKGIEMSALATEMTEDYLANLAALGVDQIDKMPRATESMGGIIQFVQQLVEKGYAYEIDGDVFFDVSRDAEYGKLTNRTPDALQGEGGEAADKKRSAADFALWKAAKSGEPSWDSPWGPGRPGWHIECSAMSREVLGETFDIHGGGLDLVFPHHENEIAQSECCHGKPMAKYWLHNGLLKSQAAGKVGGRAARETEEGPTLESIQQATDAKFSRSKGKGGLADMIATLGGPTLRFFLLRTHYRSTVEYGQDAVNETGVAMDAFYRFFERFERVSQMSFYDLPAPATRSAGDELADGQLLLAVREARQRFLSAMDDDFNTGAAISQLFELVRALNKFIDQAELEDRPKPQPMESLKLGATTLSELTGILGLFAQPLEKPVEADDQLVQGLMQILVDLRTLSRQNKDFTTADTIRDRLGDLGVVLEDRKGGTGWRLP